jgi:hypothetical protein
MVDACGVQQPSLAKLPTRARFSGPICARSVSRFRRTSRQVGDFYESEALIAIAFQKNRAGKSAANNADGSSGIIHGRDNVQSRARVAVGLLTLAAWRLVAFLCFEEFRWTGLTWKRNILSHHLRHNEVGMRAQFQTQKSVLDDRRPN